jgi:CRP-like cAMP-binding protein
MTANTPATPLSPFAVFRNRDFTGLWIAQLVSTVGGALTSLAASILIFRLTGSALSVGLMLIASAGPSIFIGLIAGVFVDRLDRKRIMVFSDLIRAVLVVLIPFLIPYNIAWLYIIVALASSVEQFFNPAMESVLPEVASDEELAAANSMMAISTFGSTAIGFAASGFIASRLPIEWAFYLDGVTFLVSAAAIYFVRVQVMEVKGGTNVATVVRNLRAGARFLWDSQVLRALLVISLPLMVAVGLWNSLLLPFAELALDASEFEFGLQEALTSVGFVIGSFVMARLADRLQAGQWLTISYLGMGAIFGLYAGVTNIPLAIFLVMISGFLNAPSSIARRLEIQRHTNREIRGRVVSAFNVSRNVLFLIGMGMAGLADVVDVRIMVFVSAVLLVLAGVMTLVMPGLRQPAAEWRRVISLLRAAPSAPDLAAGRAATPADMDLLVARLPALAGLGTKAREAFIAEAHVTEAPEGTIVVRQGEVSDAVYFVLSGQAVAGFAPSGEGYRSLSTMNPGDFFGEIAALTGSPRTATVVVAQPGTLLQVPASAMRGLMADPALSHLFLTTMTERLTRTHKTDLPRFAGLDQDSLRELRTPEPVPSENS